MATILKAWKNPESLRRKKIRYKKTYEKNRNACDAKQEKDERQVILCQVLNIQLATTFTCSRHAA